MLNRARKAAVWSCVATVIAMCLTALFFDPNDSAIFSNGWELIHNTFAILVPPYFVLFFALSWWILALRARRGRAS